MKYTKSHEWAELSGNAATVGITTYAQAELGDVVYVELPTVGQKVSAGSEVAVLESTKAAVDIYAPLSGTVTEVNLLLREYPEKINESAEKEGWLYRLEISNPAEYEGLLDAKAYESLIHP